MKKIKHKLIVKSSRVLLGSILVMNLISCNSEEAAKVNVTNEKSNSFVTDGISKVYTLGTFEGRAAEVFKSDNHLEINPLDFENTPTDVNAVYINTSSVTDAEIESFKNSIFYTDFLNKGMSIVLDSKTANDSISMKKATLELGATYTNNTCASVITKVENGIIQNIPIWDHNLVSFKVDHLPASNSIFIIKSYIYEHWDGEQNDPTALSRHVTMMKELGLSKEDNTNTNQLERTINKGSLTVPQIKDEFNRYEGWDFKIEQSTNFNSSKRHWTHFPIGGLPEVTVAVYDQAVACSGGAPMSINVANAITRSFSWQMSVSVGGKLAFPDKNVPKLMGLDLKEIAPQAGASFSATYAYTLNTGVAGTVPANRCGHMVYRKKSGLARGRFLANKISFKVLDVGSDLNDVTNLYVYTPYGQNIEVDSNMTPYWQDNYHSIYIKNPYLHTPYFTVHTF